MSFLRLNAKKHGIDPDRFVVWGSSVGAHLVALLGVTNDVDDFNTHPVAKKTSSRVQAVCN
ncbi:MAG: acetyl esterase/lipase [Candidatus Omnitrophota bacterium]